MSRNPKSNATRAEIHNGLQQVKVLRLVLSQEATALVDKHSEILSPRDFVETAIELLDHKLTHDKEIRK